MGSLQFRTVEAATSWRCSAKTPRPRSSRSAGDTFVPVPTRPGPCPGRGPISGRADPARPASSPHRRLVATGRPADGRLLIATRTSPRSGDRMGSPLVASRTDNRCWRLGSSGPLGRCSFRFAAGAWFVVIRAGPGRLQLAFRRAAAGACSREPRPSPSSGDGRSRRREGDPPPCPPRPGSANGAGSRTEGGFVGCCFRAPARTGSPRTGSPRTGSPRTGSVDRKPVDRPVWRQPVVDRRRGGRSAGISQGRRRLLAPDNRGQPAPPSGPGPDLSWPGHHAATALRVKHDGPLSAPSGSMKGALDDGTLCDRLSKWRHGFSQRLQPLWPAPRQRLRSSP